MTNRRLPLSPGSPAAAASRSLPGSWALRRERPSRPRGFRSLPRFYLSGGDRLRPKVRAVKRRVSRRGRDTIDHAFGEQDDLANAVAGAFVAATKPAAVWVSRAYRAAEYCAV